MGDVLQRAAVLCLCKLACSVLVLPLSTTSYSPVSLCCCCLLIFTDFIVAVFLGFLCLFESWLTELAALGDVVALRFLLFLSRTYAAVLLLVTPLMAVETLSRLLSDATRGTAGPAVGSAARRVESSDSDAGKRLTHVVGYVCCLSVWVIASLNVRWRWKPEEVWSAACLHTTGSLVRCLPNLFSPIPMAVSPLWAVAFLSLLLLLLTTNAGLRRRRRASAQTPAAHASERDGGRQGLVPVASAPGEPDPAASVDPEKTESSCAGHGAHFWISARHHGDFVIIPTGCLSSEREHGRTKRLTRLTFSSVQHRWGLPRPGLSVTMGLAGALAIAVLPLNLSVNILLIRTIETLLELCLRSLVSFASSTIEIATSHKETLV